MPVEQRFDVEQVLSGLKDFQRRTVDHVFRRLYTDASPTHRMLVADEVGLGKTLVARGLIARAVDHLWETVDRIDVVYICSNADIARQNIARLRLRLHGQDDFALASRITLLPTKLHHISRNRVNFVSLTPGTSFEKGSHLGTSEERALLWRLLEAAWGRHPGGAVHLLRGWAGEQSFNESIRYGMAARVDEELASRFVGSLDEEDHRRFLELCERFKWIGNNPGPSERQEQARFVADLRSRLARVCVNALEPDLVILDEFQRFAHLLDGDDEASQLARQLFTYSDAHSEVRVLLLSATPYKMYTLSQESGGDDHYRDFLRTAAFLFNDLAEEGRLRETLARYRQRLYRLGDGVDPALETTRSELERRLRSVMVRTERLAASADRDGMLVEVKGAGLRLQTEDVQAYLGLAGIARHLGQREPAEFWKSTPYCLDFMDEYQFKRAYRDAMAVAGEGGGELAKILSEARGFLSRRAIEGYRRLEPGNVRLRSLLEDMIESGLWRLLWMPAALPYWRPAGPFATLEGRDITKRLVFSSWQVVPKAIAGLVSYEAERRMIRLHERRPRNTAEARRRRAPLLRFASDRSSGEERLTGMPVLALVYPSPALAGLCEPVDLAAAGASSDAARIIARLADRLGPRLRAAGARPAQAGPADEQWYWAASLLLDVQEDRGAALDWLGRRHLAAAWSGGDADDPGAGERSRWADHTALAREVATDPSALGPAPDDLATVVARMALGSPGTLALRTLARQAGGGARLWEPWLRDAAGSCALAFRHLFNTPEATALLRGLAEDEAYWRRVIDYCIDGNLQSVLDEHAHLLRDSMGLFDREPDETATAIAQAIARAAGLRASSLGIDLLGFNRGRPSLSDATMRGRFARRFDRSSTYGSGEATTAEQVREAFNSPFWPFVLATTSVGQEGLDFHPYCHAVVHWNLPHNPVDLEQREGRVHRFKNHAVRKNLARRYGLAPLAEADDPWERLFELGVRDRPSAASDLVPFWVYPARDDPAAHDDDRVSKIERHVPMLPLSREAERIGDLRRSLAVYRMVFGQPRQEDLLGYLLERLGPERAAEYLEELRIDLSPGGPTIGQAGS